MQSLTEEIANSPNVSIRHRKKVFFALTSAAKAAKKVERTDFAPIVIEATVATPNVHTVNAELGFLQTHMLICSRT